MFQNMLMNHWKNREVVLAAIKQDGYVLRFAHQALKNKDKSIVLGAVKQDIWDLKFAHESLKHDVNMLDEISNLDHNHLYHLV